MGKSQHLFAKEMRQGRGPGAGDAWGRQVRKGPRCREIGVTLGSKEGGSEKHGKLAVWVKKRSRQCPRDRCGETGIQVRQVPVAKDRVSAPTCVCGKQRGVVVCREIVR